MTTDHEAPGNAGGSPIPADSITGAELRIAREDLGLTVDEACARVGVHNRTWRRWEHDYMPVPSAVAAEVGRWTDYADVVIEAAVARLLDEPEPVLTVPRSGDVDGWPAAWWRAVAARVVEDVPGLRVTYREP